MYPKRDAISKSLRDKTLDIIPEREVSTFKKLPKNLESDTPFSKLLTTTQSYNQGSQNQSEHKNDSKNQNSKWRTTSNLQIKDDKSMLMEKFESSLKERLLSSKSFTKQVPLFDGTINEKTRMKTPVDEDEDLSKSESVFNSVFPVRKEAVKNLNYLTTEDGDRNSKHARESNDWLKQVENNMKKDIPRMVVTRTQLNQKLNTFKNSIGEKDTDKLKGLSKSKLQNYNSEDSNKKDVKSPKVTDRDYKRSKRSSEILEREKRSNKIIQINNQGDFLSPQISKSKLYQEKKISKFTSDKKERLDEEPIKIPKALTDERLPSRGDTSFNKVVSSDLKTRSEGKDIIFREKTLLENESIDIKGPYSKVGNIQGKMEGSLSDNYLSNGSFDFSKEMKIRLAQAEKDKVTHWTEYKIGYAEMEKEESTSKQEPKDEPLNQTSGISIRTAGNEIIPDNILEDKEDEEEDVKELKGEEDCTEEPCNEPSWFVDYGIDKKKRKEMGTSKKQKGSESSSEEDIDLTAEELPEIIEILPSEPEIKKKKKKKKEEESAEYPEPGGDVIEVLEEIEGPELKAIREIITVPLICIEETKEKEKERVEDGTEEVVKVEEQVEEVHKGQSPMEYLQKYIGQYLVAGLAKVALHMPSDPVEYLAHWLIKERRKEDLIEEMKQLKAEVKKIKKENMADIRKKQQLSNLKNEAYGQYFDIKDQPLYPVFDSETETDIDFMEHKMEEDEPVPVS